MNEALFRRRLSPLLLDARREERARIARELHDSLFQGVQGLMFRLQAVRELLPERPLEAMAIVKKIYVDVPEYLHPAAANSVRSHLRKLERESRVVEHEKRWSVK